MVVEKKKEKKQCNNITHFGFGDQDDLTGRFMNIPPLQSKDKLLLERHRRFTFDGSCLSRSFQVFLLIKKELDEHCI